MNPFPRDRENRSVQTRIVMLCVTLLACDAGSPGVHAAAEQPAALPRTRARIAEGAQVNVVLYGDSISEVGRSPRWHGGASSSEANWGSQLVGRLAAAHPGARFKAEHFAIGGQNTYEGLGRLDGLQSLAPDLVLVAFGANDCCHHFLEPAETELALVSLAKEIRTRFDADVIVVGTGGDNPREPFFRHLSETLEAQRRAAASAGVPFVDVRQAVLAATDHGSTWADFHCGPANCHPNDAGHGVWARAAFARIQELMQHPPSPGEQKP